jgi:hypothetical protein
MKKIKLSELKRMIREETKPTRVWIDFKDRVDMIKANLDRFVGLLPYNIGKDSTFDPDADWKVVERFLGKMKLMSIELNEIVEKD